MFERLQQKWKVGPLQIVLIIICFALGGSLTGYSAKKVMDVLSIDKDWLWTIIYIFLVTLIWPLAVLVVGVFFGQFGFFRGYVTRLGRKIGMARSSKFGVQSSESVLSTPHSPLTTHRSLLAALSSESTPESL